MWVDNNVLLKVAFDTGAATSVLSAQVALKFNIPFEPCEIKYHGVDNQTKTAIGVTKEVEISFGSSGEYDFKEKFLVIEYNDYDALIGMPFFNKTKVGLFAADNYLTYNGQIIPLDGYFKNDREEEREILISELYYDEVDEEMGWETVTEQKLFKTKAEITLLKNDLIKFKDVVKTIEQNYAYDLSDLSTCNVAKHEIHTIECPPVFTPPYRRSQQEQDMIQEQADMLESLGIIEKSNSPYNSPVHVIPKKDGSKRFVIDYRNINSITISEAWPIPMINDIFDKMSGAHVFSTIDLNSAYYQIEVEINSRKYTAFSTSNAHYQFIKMPFGLKNAPAQFQRIMYQVFGCPL